MVSVGETSLNIDAPMLNRIDGVRRRSRGRQLGQLVTPNTEGPDVLLF
jgi:hypothetical protein